LLTDVVPQLKSISLRTLVSAIGLFVAITTAVSLPIGYFVVGYANMSSLLDFKSDLNARYVAKYIYAHDILWQYQRVRLAELLEQADVEGDSMRKRIVDVDGALVVDEGPQLPAPLLVRSSPVVVAGTAVGKVEVAASLRGLLHETGLLAILSSLFGFGMFLAVRAFPLKVLDQTLGTLANTNRQFDAALSNMSQGLLLFDSSKRIVVVNRKYIEMYGLSLDVVKPGCAFGDLLRHRKEMGSFRGDVEEYCAKIDADLAEGKATSRVVETPDGRSILLVNQPMVGGGWVATHEDVTEQHSLLRAHGRAEELLREQKLQLDTALNNMMHGLCMFDAQGKVILFNQRYSEMMGLPAESLLGRSLLDILKHRKTTREFAADPERHFASIIAAARACETTTKIMENAHGRSLRVVDHPMASGGWVATFEDITEQRRTERERDRNREFLDQIIENVPAIIFVKRASDRRYVLVNRAAETFWGVSRKDILGRTSYEVFSKAEADRITARDDELLQSNQSVFDERQIDVAPGGVRSIFSRRLSIQGEDGSAQYVLGVVEDVTERKHAEERIAHMAHYDALTELPNRVLLREKLDQELAFVRRGGRLAVLYLDLDHFKSVNDTLGHSAGDELLKAVTGRLRGCLREVDIFARLGGDEFAIVQTGLQHPTDAAVLAQRLRDEITRTSYELNGHQVVVDISIGIALSPNDGTDVDQLLKCADMALYGAKSDGRGTFRYFEPEMDARMKLRRALEVDLRKALVNGEFELHFQPLVRLADNEVSGCEALLRWHHPERGMVPPAEFIPVAEETGLINAIGEWVLRQACAEAATWPSDIKVAVNVSPVQFRNQSLPQIVIGALAATGLAAHRLELEITESVLMQSNEMTPRMLHQLRELGVRISMDDFGTGYSSLSYLRSFPFNKIKIDRSFINDLSHGNNNAVAIVQAIITLANSLNMTTTAEGVETEQQLEILRAMGCIEMQGYLFSPPRSKQEISRELVARRKGLASAA
jgi:diguanylate cyclase (GGDEF)-like protein/PAS domain S-box-containing protein